MVNPIKVYQPAPRARIMNYLRCIVSFIIVMCCFMAVSPASAQEQPSRVTPQLKTGVWNGFNQHLNVIECSYLGDTELEVIFRFNNDQGQEQESTSVVFSPRTSKHLIIGDLFDISNAYGTYTIVSRNTSDDLLLNDLACSTLMYSFSERGVEYALLHPLVRHHRGERFGTFNTLNPISTAEQTQNWLTLLNTAAVASSYQILVYDIEGALQSTEVVDSLGPYQRRDILLSLPTGLGVGSYRIIPAEKTLPFAASVSRYAAQNGSFAFALTLDVSEDDCQRSPLFLSTLGSADNWVEFANPTDQTITVEARITDSLGALVQMIEYELAPFAQRHVYIKSVLGDNAVGSMSLTCGSDRVIASSLVYGFDPTSSGVVSWAFSSQGVEKSLLSRQVYTLNSFLNTQQWLKIARLDSTSLDLVTLFYQEDGSLQSSLEYTILGQSTLDIGIHLFFPLNSIGVADIGQNLMTIASQVVRIIPRNDGTNAYTSYSGSKISEEPRLSLQSIMTGLDTPVYLTHAGDESNRLFVVLRKGPILIYENGVLLETPFLDLTGRVGLVGEQGLLGLAFHPDYESNGVFFVHYTDTSGDTVVSQYQVSMNPNLADSSSETVVFTAEQPHQNHNGGQIEFGPDGYLYIALGDGGRSGDQFGNAQNLTTTLGAVLRIDVGTQPYSIPNDNPFVGQSGVAEEIFAYGLRNPWRFSFDRQTGDLYVADVGQGRLEEVNLVTSGKNFGWPTMEGSECFNADTCDKSELSEPIAEYLHEEGATAIIGGYVYRGTKYPALVGKYFFADFTAGKIWMLEQIDTNLWQRTLVYRGQSLFLSSMGEGEDGELYAVDITGTVYSLQLDD